MSTTDLKPFGLSEAANIGKLPAAPDTRMSMVPHRCAKSASAASMTWGWRTSRL